MKQMLDTYVKLSELVCTKQRRDIRKRKPRIKLLASPRSDSPLPHNQISTR
uniref:Uncharacterized protein n=1 Tax=Arion vulgaris TaxID=1028688 RepID=A0A0B6Z415_9EUPU